MPKFTIIAPVYNTEHYLPQFLDSVVNQTFRDFELILVDDGSTDKSLDICKSYAKKDNRITVLTQKNQGAGPARNNGIKNAKGEYLLFLDSDDWIDPLHLDTVHKNIKLHPCDLLIFGMEEILFNKNGIEINKTAIIPKFLDLNSAHDCRQEFCNLVFTSIINSPCNKLYKKEIIDKYSVEFADTKRAQDAFFNMDYYRHIKSIYSIPDVLYYYRANTTDKVWKKFPKDLYKIEIKYDRYMVDIFTEFGLYEGMERNKLDSMFYNRLLHTVGFFRNPKWALSYKEKLEYIDEIICDEYNQNRAKEAITCSTVTKKIKNYILNKDSKGLFFYFYAIKVRRLLYNFYAEKIKPKIKR